MSGSMFMVFVSCFPRLVLMGIDFTTTHVQAKKQIKNIYLLFGLWVLKMPCFFGF